MAHSTTEPRTGIDQETVSAVLAGRIARGLPSMLAEVYAAARAHAAGQPFYPSTSGMELLIELTRDSWRADQAMLAREAPPWLRAYAERHDLETREPLTPGESPAAFGDAHDPQLLSDEVPSYLLSLPPVAHGIAPLPPLGGWEHRDG